MPYSVAIGGSGTPQEEKALVKDLHDLMKKHEKIVAAAWWNGNPLGGVNVDLREAKQVKPILKEELK